MKRFLIPDFPSMEKAPTSRRTLVGKLSSMMDTSYSTRVRVDVINPDTGEYRIVLQGTLDCDPAW